MILTGLQARATVAGAVEVGAVVAVAAFGAEVDGFVPIVAVTVAEDGS